LVAVSMSAREDTVQVGRRAIAVSHPDKELFTAPAITKLTLARHYARVSAAMLPHVRDRPLALESFPQGIAGTGFFIKSIPRHFPDWIATAEVAKRGGSLVQALANDPATLVYLAGQNVVTPHVWLARVADLRRPDRLIIDLDPSPGVRFADVRAAARDAGERLRSAGLATFAMVTGSRGVHVVSPLRPEADFTTVHRFARALAEAMVADAPNRLTLEWHRTERGQRIYIDVNRIAYAQHVVAPYGVRARPRAPVAMPIAWEELSDPRLRPDRWTVRTAAGRLDSEGDAWARIARHARGLPA